MISKKEVAYEKKLQQRRDWYVLHREEEIAKAIEWQKNHPEEAKGSRQLWSLNHPEQVKAKDREQSRKGGKYYEHHKQHKMTRLPHEKNLVRGKHQRIWTPYKQIIAPDSVLHHEWIPKTANYRGVALVEKEPHQHGYIDVIQIMEGEITLLTEEEVRAGEAK